MKYPIETLKSDLHQFVHVKKFVSNVQKRIIVLLQCVISMHDAYLKLYASTILGETFDFHVRSYKTSLLAYQKTQ